MLSSEIISGAQAAQRTWGVPACVGLAQCIDESGGFREIPPRSCNGLGIKALSGFPSVQVPTHEVVHGQVIETMAHFAQFPSIAVCFYQWGKLLATNAVYHEAFVVRTNWQQFIQKMAPHYATDPNYAAKLIKIVQAEKLDQYNV